MSARRRSSDAAPGSPWSGTGTPHSPRTPTRASRYSVDQNQNHAESPPVPRVQQHHRAHSFSTLNDTSRDGDGQAVRVVIKSPDKHRPVTADQLSGPMLEVAIPNHRLGSPRFSARGTAILHSSVYTRNSTAEGLRSSAFSDGIYDQAFPLPPHLAGVTQGVQVSPLAVDASVLRRPLGNTHPSQGPVDSHLYDYLTFQPTSDDPSIVRYSPVNGSISAATCPRLIAQITSPNFLDYDLLSDFFLTYRSFMPTHDLVAYLVARLQWAVNRRDDVGKIVKVRTFVALRHWLLNYFVDDFYPDYRLREVFCASLHDVCVALKQMPDGGGSDVKLIGELKKCWRRTCDLYFDENSAGLASGDSDDILPGGKASSRDDQSRPTIQGPQPVIDSVLARDGSRPNLDMTSHFSGLVQAEQPASTRPDPVSPVAREQNFAANARVISASSQSSVQALSCSIPTRGFRRMEAVLAGDTAPHPIAVSPNGSSSPSFGQPPSQLHGEPRTAYARKRLGSLSDAMRDDRAPAGRADTTPQNASKPAAEAHAGSLIRGNLILPSSALVQGITWDARAPDSQTRLLPFPNEADLDVDMGQKSGTVSGPGMRKLLGSMRRALSNKNGWTFDGPSNALSSSFSDEKGGHPTRYITAKPSQRRQADVENEAPRVDILLRKVLDSYTKSQKEAQVDGLVGLESKAYWFPQIDLDLAQSIDLPLAGVEPKSDAPSMMTMGSKSIVIVNDTRPPPLPDQLGEMPNGDIANHVASLNLGASHDLAGGFRPVEANGKENVNGNLVNADPSRSFSFTHTASDVERTSTAAKPRTLHDTNMTGHASVRSRGKSFKSTRSMSMRKKLSSHGGRSRQGTLRSFDAITFTGSEDDGSNDYFQRPPGGRMLRRRPGGDLRAAQKVTDLEPISRPRSAGSLTNRSCSMSSSILRASGSLAAGPDNEYAREQRRRFSLGAVAEVHNEKALSLMHTHSSQPNLRPSFEAEVAKLARLPDGDEDGGIESTLLKLEGRFERRESDESPLDYELRPASQCQDAVRASRADTSAEHDVKQEHVAHADVDGQGLIDSTAPATRNGTPALNNAVDNGLARPRSASFLHGPRRRKGPASPSVVSEDSYSSIPLLERGLSERSLGDSELDLNRSAPETPRASLRVRQRNSRPRTPQQMDRRNSKKRPKHPTPSSNQGTTDSFLLDEGHNESFLLDEDEDLSDFSEDLSIDEIMSLNITSPSTTTFPPMTPGTVVSDAGISSHPLRHPPSPLTSEHALPMLTVSEANQFQEPPLTPESSPVDKVMMRTMEQKHDKLAKLTGASREVLIKHINPVRKPAVHLPFILAHDADLLARQFTICEKDALSEIDWRELVELRWRQTPPTVHNWVDYLRTQDPKGVELVIARFNVMVKWALSEIVLTKDIHERAMTISKYIQIAVSARQYRNYATMYQIAVAVLSTDCSRLTETWAHVPASDVRAIAELEILIQPVRNFHNLRVEMETASAEDGCIPFIGE